MWGSSYAGAADEAHGVEGDEGYERMACMARNLTASRTQGRRPSKTMTQHGRWMLQSMPPVDNREGLDKFWVIYSCPTVRMPSDAARGSMVA